MLTRARSFVVAGLALVLLAGCGGGDDGGEKAKKKPGKADSSVSSAPEPYLEVPKGVTLTPPGTTLGLGEVGTIAFQLRQDQVGVVEVAVHSIERTSFQASFGDWPIDETAAARTPYFVRLTVTNRGIFDLGGLQLDNVLWANVGSGLEAPNYYSAEQLPGCPGGPLPSSFGQDRQVELCQTYFIAAGQTLESITFTPFGGLDPISWKGAESPVGTPGKLLTPSASPSASPSAKPSGSASAKPSGTATAR